MKTKTYVEKVSVPECTAVHHVWSGESPEIGSLCECGQSRWDESHLTKRAADCCLRCGANDWRDAIVPDTLEICNVCGNSR